MFALNFRSVVLLPAALLLAAAPAIHAEEGMWTFDNPPLKQLAAKYNFHPTQEWLDHLRLSSVRLNDGGSGSFVSPRRPAAHQSSRGARPVAEELDRRARLPARRLLRRHAGPGDEVALTWK